LDGARARGHPAALAAISAMIRGNASGAVLLVGPEGIGKTTLATDLAAGLLCTEPDLGRRPCGTCRACRLAFSGTHPDLHRLGPEGPGRQVVIGGPGSKVRGVRDLISELSLLPVEGGARVAIIEAAHRLNEDAQAALLKTLEEPPAGTTIVLCAAAEEPLLPTIRSRSARLRLGPVGVREIEAILADHGAADPPTAARIARFVDGRPGLALAWAQDPEALRERDAVGRALLDLLGAGAGASLTAIRALAAPSTVLAAVAISNTPVTAAAPPTDRTQTAAAPAGQRTDDDESIDRVEPARVPATERRRAAEALIAVWSDVARDLALCQRGLVGSVRDIARLDESVEAAARSDPGAVRDLLDRIGHAAVLIAGNVSPELVLDDLALAWGRLEARAAA
jgi:DNA polymerase III delta' subunit